MTGVTARWALGFVAAATVGAITLPVAATAKDPVEGESVCEISDPALAELSGLVAVDDGYWAIGDGTEDMTELVITHLDSDCTTSGTLGGYWAEGGGPDPYDPEDLAIDADGTLWVADTGDNELARADVAIHQVSPDGVANTFWFTYPDGAHDTEALLLQPDGTPLLASKDAGESHIYRPTGPVENGSDKLSPVPLEEVAVLPLKATDTPGGPEEVNGLPLGDLPSTLVTGGAVSPDGDKVVLRTYTDAYEWEVADGDVAAAIADGEPTVTPLPNEPQGESIAYTPDGEQYVTASEASDTEDGWVDPQLWTYTPGAVPEEQTDEATTADDESFLDMILDGLGPEGILQVVGGIGVLGLIMVVIGIIVIVKARRRRKEAAAAKAERDRERRDRRHDDHDGPDGHLDPGHDEWGGPGPDHDEWEVRQRRPDHHPDDGFGPRDDGYGRRDDGYAARDDGYGRRDDGYAPRDDGYARRDDGYAPRDRGGPPRRDPHDDGLGGGRLFEPTGLDAPRHDQGYPPPPGRPRDGYDDDPRSGDMYRNGGRY